MSKYDVMVDLETMGDTPTAPIVSIGAVAFDPTGDEPIDPSKPLTTFSRNVNLATSMAHGMMPTADTIYWWMRQPDSSRLATLDNVQPLWLALSDFTSWLQMVQGVEGRFRNKVWAWPPSFDLVILQNAYLNSKPVSCTPPWRRRQERDARTWCMETGVVAEGDPAPKWGDEHVAVNDAIGQALAVQAANRKVWG